MKLKSLAIILILSLFFIFGFFYSQFWQLTSDGSIQPVGDRNVVISGTLLARSKMGTDISGAVNLNTSDLHGVLYHFTAAATATLDAAADAGYGACAGFKVRDAAEAAVIDVQGTEKINLDGTALAAGTAITATGAGSYVMLCATTDTDGSGTDGWESWGNNGFASE